LGFGVYMLVSPSPIYGLPHLSLSLHSNPQEQRISGLSECVKLVSINAFFLTSNSKHPTRTMSTSQTHDLCTSDVFLAKKGRQKQQGLLWISNANAIKPHRISISLDSCSFFTVLQYLMLYSPPQYLRFPTPPSATSPKPPSLRSSTLAAQAASPPR